MKLRELLRNIQVLDSCVDMELEISGVNRVNPLRSAPEFIEVSAS